MSFVKYMRTVLILTLLLAGYQNCSSYQSAGSQNKSNTTLFSGNGDPYTGIGNGDPYTGIASQSGLYKNFGYNFQCPDGRVILGLQPIATLSVNVDTRQVTLINRCDKNIATLDFEDLRVPQLDRDSIIYGGGIYQYVGSFIDNQGPPGGNGQAPTTYTAVHCSTTDIYNAYVQTDLVIKRNVVSGQLQLESYFTAQGEVSEAMNDLQYRRFTNRVLLSSLDDTVALTINHAQGDPLQESYTGTIARRFSTGDVSYRPIECTVEQSLID